VFWLKTNIFIIAFQLRLQFKCFICADKGFFHVLPLVLNCWGTTSHDGTVGTTDNPAQLQLNLEHAHTIRILSCKSKFWIICLVRLPFIFFVSLFLETQSLIEISRADNSIEFCWLNNRNFPGICCDKPLHIRIISWLFMDPLFLNTNKHNFPVLRLGNLLSLSLSRWLTEAIKQTVKQLWHRN
jgi:hypothetical protein